MTNTASSGQWSIDGNDDFSVTATVENWPGNGTQSFPYVIDGYNLTGSFDSNLLEIMNTDVYFRIINCLLSQGWNGIHLINVTNGEISNNTVVNNSESGIFLENSEKCILSGNTIINNSEHGILLHDHSENNILSRNTVINNSKHGIKSWNSGNNNLTRNTVTNNRWTGISSGSNSGNNIISGNLIVNNNPGIFLYWSGNNTILDNVLINNRGGLLIDNLRPLEDYLQAIVTNNSVNDKPLVYWQNITGGTVPSGAGQIFLVNSDFVEVTGQSAEGVQGAFCTNLNIHNNSISNGIRGIMLSNSTNSILTNNTVTNSWDGISIEYYSKNNTLSYNTVTNNEYGISIEWESENNTLANNIVVNNSGDGIKLDTVWFNTFSDNIVSNNSQFGIHSYVSLNSTFSGNTVANNSDYGIYFYWSKENTFSGNTVANNSDYGIYLNQNSDNNTVVFNDFSGNKASGSQAADDGSSNTFAYNFWDEWISPDNNTDGIVDNPYSIDGSANNHDNYPLVISPTNHYLLQPIITSPSGGETLSGDVTISWVTSVDTWDYNVMYNVSYSIDGGTTWTLLKADLTATNFIWDTNTVPDGSNYILKIEAISSGNINVMFISLSPFSIANPTTTTTTTTPTPTMTITTTTTTTPSWNALLLLLSLFVILSWRQRKKWS
jgi:parallel beta-helix repeat protein